MRLQIFIFQKNPLALTFETDKGIFEEMSGKKYPRLPSIVSSKKYL